MGHQRIHQSFKMHCGLLTRNQTKPYEPATEKSYLWPKIRRMVTSTLTMCTDPYPTEVVQKPDEPDKASEVPCGQTDPVPNGVETVAGDGDEEMTDAEADENTTNTDAEMQEEKVTETSDSDSDLRSDANTSQELHTTSEPQNP